MPRTDPDSGSALRPVPLAAGRPLTVMIQRLHHCGLFLHHCACPAEQAQDEVFAAHPNGIQLDPDRFLLLCATRGHAGTDDDRSIVAQVRGGGYDGPVRSQRVVAAACDRWDPLGDGTQLVRQHGHPVAFGVPRGAVDAAGPLAGANCFAIKWRVSAHLRDPATGLLRALPPGRPELEPYRQFVEWMQVRLPADGGDELEIVQPPMRLRQRGYDDGPRFCDHAVAAMNQGFVQAVPLTPDGSTWVDVNHFEGGRIAALRYDFDNRAGRYVWTRTGPLLGDAVGGLSEAGLAPWRSDWIISARRLHGDSVAWMRLHDLLSEVPAVVCPADRRNNAPLTTYRCADGRLRTLGGDPHVSPHHNGRDPLYMWEVDPDHGFASGDRRVVFDCIAADAGIPQAQVPRVDMAKLLPHAGGRRQLLVHRVRSKATLDPRTTGRRISPREQEACGVYLAELIYDEPHPCAWSFQAQPIRSIRP